jgi:pimeloyl-ACP methyl ester carboxylesterase
MMLPGSVDGSDAYVRGDYQRIDLEAGHFPHEESPDAFMAALLDWLPGVVRG